MSNTFLPSIFFLLRLHVFLIFVRSVLASSPVRGQFIAELRQPEGSLSGAPYPYMEIKEAHELIFSCCHGQQYFLWARTHDDGGDGGVTQHGGRNSCPLLRSCFIGSCHVGVSKRFSRSISPAVYTVFIHPNNRSTETCSLGLPCTFLYDIML